LVTHHCGKDSRISAVVGISIGKKLGAALNISGGVLKGGEMMLVNVGKILGNIL